MVGNSVSETWNLLIIILGGCTSGSTNDMAGSQVEKWVELSECCHLAQALDPSI